MTPESEDKRMLAAWLAGHDESCPLCRYSLRGISGAACPECGARLRLGVVSPEAALGAWTLAVVSFALALGFDGVALVLLGGGVAVGVATGGLSLLDGLDVLTRLSPLIALGAGSACGLWVMAARRVRWSLMERGRQRRRALGIFLGVGAAHAIGGLAMGVLIF